jgi:hypothetical protein
LTKRKRRAAAPTGAFGRPNGAIPAIDWRSASFYAMREYGGHKRRQFVG